MQLRGLVQALRPSLSTMRTRSAAFLAPSFSMMRARCTSIVRGLMPSSRPACLLDDPDAIWPSTSRPCFDGFAHPRHHGTGIKRLLDEIKRAVLDRLHRHRNIANARDDEDRRR